jgi:hypothetical protein
LLTDRSIITLGALRHRSGLLPGSDETTPLFEREA